MKLNGLMSKLEDNQFIIYNNYVSFICLIETFINKVDTSNLDDVFNDYTCIASPAIKLSKYGRGSGVCCVLLELIYCILSALAY